jgi:hypothetical protein
MSEPDRSFSSPRYWFPAKTYGWGWGQPSTWEGWVVLGGYLSVLVALCVLVLADCHPYWFCTELMPIIAGLIVICWWKGEPPRWRWG